MSITATDLFCGAGGSSCGAAAVPGVRVRIAANHWNLAVETHNSNHPDTDHDCADLSQVDPRRYPTTDILWASPECTNHSQAKGRKRNADAQPDLFGETLPDEAADRSRATMWDVPRFAEHHHYRAVIVENVVDAAKWVMWPAWLQAMTCLGYEHHVVYLNSMHAQTLGLPAPQSRDRLYVVFWRRGQLRPDFDKWLRPTALCTEHGRVTAVQAWKRPDRRWGRYRAQYLYRCPSVQCRNQVLEPGWLPAASAIDWTIPGQRIGDRSRPLAAKTRARIEAGLRRHWAPIHLEAGGNQYDAMDPNHPQHGQPGGYVRAWPTAQPLRTLHTAATKALAYTDQLAPTNEAGLLVPAGGTWNDTATPLTQVMRTRTTRESDALVVPLRNHNTTKPAAAPLDTVAANGNHHGLLMPYYGNATVTTTEHPVGTLTTVDRYAMITRHNTARGDQGQMSTPPREPLRTLTTAGHQSLTEWTDHPSDDWLPEVDECLFRMLEPHEIKAGMAFHPGYLLLGSKREQVKLAGNAVTPPAARDLIACVAESLGVQLHRPTLDQGVAA